MNKKITVGEDYSGSTIADGWYLISLEPVNENEIQGNYHKVVSGFIVAEKLVTVDVSTGPSLYYCGTNGFYDCV